MKSWALSVITLAYRPRVLRRVEDLHPLLRCAWGGLFGRQRRL